MQVKIPNQLTQQQGIARVKQAIDDARPQLAGKATIQEESWQDNVLTFAFVAEGQSISGTLTVLDHEFALYAKLPLMMKLFEGKIEKMIAAQAQQMLK